MEKPMTCSILLKQIHDTMEKRANRALREKHLTMSQAAVLMHLYDAEGKALPLKEIEHSFGVAQSTAAGIVARLEQKGLIEHIEDDQDHRIKMVRITAKGTSCCVEAFTGMNQTEKNMLDTLTASEQKTFRRLLKKVNQNLH